MSGEDGSARTDMQTRLDRLLDEVESGGAEAPPPSPTPPAPGGETGAAGLLNGLLSHPELLSGLPTLLGAITPLMKGLGSATGSTGAPGGAKRPPDRHTALLRALKPYLSPERRQATETVLELLAVWDALSGMGLTLPGVAVGRREAPDGGEAKRDV